MHSRIFVVKDIDNPQEERLYDCEELLGDYLINIADYVIVSHDTFDDWKWLLKVYETFMTGDWSNKTITIHFNELEKYYENKTNLLKSMVEKIDKRSWQYWDMAMYKIQQEINDEFGFYIANEFAEVDTIDVWLSLVYAKMIKANLDTMTFQIVQTFDYHS